MDSNILVSDPRPPASASPPGDSDPTAQQILGDRLLALNRRDEAIAAYERAIQLDPAATWCHNNLGHALSGLHRWDEAVAAYGRAAALEPEVWTIHRDLGHALARAKRLDEAVSAFRRAIALQPGAPDTHHALGDVLFDAGRWADAVAAYQDAVRVDPAAAASHANLGNALGRLGRWHDAVVAYRRATDLDPANARAHNDLGNALATQGRWEVAAPAYQHAIDAGMTTAASYCNLGQALLELSRHEEAEAAYRNAVALSPDHGAAHLGLARALFRLARWEDAARTHARANRLSGDREAAGQSSAGAAGSVRLAADVAAIAPQSPTFTSLWRFLGTTPFTPGDDFVRRMQDLEREEVTWISTLKQNNSKIWPLGDAIPGARCLTMGPLEGALEKHLCDLGAARVLAVEGYRPNYLKCGVLKTVFPSLPVEFVEGDVSEITIAPGHDVVFCPGVLYHLPEPQLLLEKVRACEPSLFFITTQLAVDPDHPAFGFRQLGDAAEIAWGGRRYRVRAFREVRKPGGYLTGLDYARPSMWFYADEIVRLLKDMDFRVEDAYVADLGQLGVCGAYVCSTPAAGSRARQFRVPVGRRLARWMFSRVIRRMSIEEKLRATDFRG